MNATCTAIGLIESCYLISIFINIYIFSFIFLLDQFYNINMLQFYICIFWSYNVRYSFQHETGAS